jgi:hypothetical protein
MQAQKNKAAAASASAAQAPSDLSFRIIEDLQSCGINVSDIKKLQEAGLHTIG